jgi:Tol biopolymer transport system component
MKLIFGRTAALPAWSPDGAHIAFAGDAGVFEADAAGTVEPKLLSPMRAWTQQYSPDGRSLLVIELPKLELELIPLEGDRKPISVGPPGSTYFPATFSPDGRFISYTSAESGRNEVYVRATPPASGKWLISNGGGGMAAWRGDGHELFYLSADLRLMAVDIRLTPSFQPGTPHALFQPRTTGIVSGRNNYVVSRDGQRFLIYTPPEDTELGSITLVVNWPTLLKRN